MLSMVICVSFEEEQMIPYALVAIHFIWSYLVLAVINLNVQGMAGVLNPSVSFCVISGAS